MLFNIFSVSPILNLDLTKAIHRNNLLKFSSLLDSGPRISNILYPFKCQLQSLTEILTVIALQSNCFYWAVNILLLGRHHYTHHICLIKYYLKIYKLVKWLYFCTFLITSLHTKCWYINLYRVQVTILKPYEFILIFSFKNPLMV